MNFMIPSFDTHHHKRKGTIMTTLFRTNQTDSNSTEMLKLRREKIRQRRRRQMNAFFDSVKAQNADKVIFLFDNDLNIA